MDKKYLDVLNRLKDHELAVADLYMKLAMLLVEDRAFWTRLSMEEKGHASVLQSEKLMMDISGLIITELVEVDIELIDQVIGEIEDFRNLVLDSPKLVTREVALRFALNLEDSGVERIFQELLELTTDDKAIEIFQNLCTDCGDHSNKIRVMLAELDQ